VELGDVDELAHSAVGLGGIEGDLALEAYGTDDEFGELADGELLAGAHVDVTVADLAQARNGSATTSTMVSIHSTIGAGAKMH